MIIIKQYANGQEKFRYNAVVKRQDEDVTIVHATFQIPDSLFFGLPIKAGDLFVEAFYPGKWYNIFEIYDRDDGQLKGWYCNLSRPPVITDQTITFQDLALDVLLIAGGVPQILDEDEYLAQKLDAVEAAQVQSALQELRRILAEPGFCLRTGS
jgi:hypothetical protein